ncbi:MAG TPA: hypothetical protein VM925_22515, partial [Labilithrix sp.]|nr:hypothetical protein [Labilithrix sp.]
MLLTRARSAGVRAVAFAFAICTPACTKGTAGDGSGSTTSLAASAKAPSTKSAKATETPRDAAVIDFLGSSSDCSFGHRGALIDLGDPSTAARMSGGRLAKADLDIREREGASWVSVRARSLEMSFVSSTEVKAEAGIVVEARVRGGAAKSASVYLNGKPVGTLAFTKGETGIVSARTSSASIFRGTNELLLRFNGGGRAQHDQLAELDWIRVGPNDGDAPYSAPTRSDAITSVSIANTPRRSISLRAPGVARCTAFIPTGSILEGFVGTAGGEADAEVRVLVD